MAKKEVAGFVTCYQVAIKLNEALKPLGLGEVKTQMLYNYAKNGLIKTELIEGQNLVSIQNCDEFVAKQVEKRGAKVLVD